MAREVEIGRDEYERRVLGKLREELLKGRPLIEREGRIKVEDVSLDASGPLHRVLILFRETARAECLFGFWAKAVGEETESSADPLVFDPLEGYWGPEEWASTIVVTHFVEQVEALGLGLPADCDPDGISWVNGYRRLPPERAREGRPEAFLKRFDGVSGDWQRATESLTLSLEEKGWFVLGPARYALTGSAEEGDDFRYHLIVYDPVIEAVEEGESPVYELYDEAHGVVAYAREVPTPERAAGLLRRYGVPVEKGNRIRDKLPEPPEQMLPGDL